jgi:catechol 2,3-dioxygenase-like lactoylglutathione lyase family enzyme
MVLPLLTRIDHVGIACRDLDRAVGLYQATFGLEVASIEVNEEQGVREAMLAVGGSAAGDPAGAGTFSCSSRWDLTRPSGSSSPAGARGCTTSATASPTSARRWLRSAAPASG